MPSKSDSAGKLHQYFTCKEIENKCNAICISPLEDIDERNFHLASFNKNEVKSLKKIGDLSADVIISCSTSTILKVEDIGVNSGAVGYVNTDDLEVTLKNGEEIGYSLKCAKGISQILSKNMGAKSLVKEYFNSSTEQDNFNEVMEESHLVFLNSVLGTTDTSISELKKKINEDAESKGLDKARFGDECYSHANESRNLFLKALRNELLRILKVLNRGQLASAANLILDTGKNNVLADYRLNKEKVEFVSIPLKQSSNIKDVKERGNDSVTIETSDYSIGFRYKFESGITSSIKLVGDYKKKI